MAYGTINADVIQSSVTGVSLGAGNATRFKNRIINGNMTIDQRNAGASVTPTNGQFITDRWSAQFVNSGKYTIQQNAGAITPPTGFTNYLGATSTSAYSITAGDIFQTVQAIEGYNMADFGWGTANAQTVTLSFWVYSSLTGTFGGSLVGGQTYVFSYSIPTANTWTKISVTIAGSTSGTWASTNAAGIFLTFCFGVGSTYTATPGSWAVAASARGPTGQVNVTGTSGATFYITGVQLEVGSSATGFEVVDYGTQLAMCQRYYEILTGNGVANFLSATLTGNVAASWCTWFLKQTKRTTPTFALVAGGGWANVNPTAYSTVDNIAFTATNYFYTANTMTASAEL